MKHTIFTGAATAIITPFTEEGIDWDAFGRLIDYQLAGGIDALVVAGTTGEGSTLTDREHEDAVTFCVKRTAGKVPVIAGTGSNNTAHAIERTKTACNAGADAVLLVTPYYNKTTQRGLIASFSAIADASSVPCILYNVPNLSQIAKERLLCGDDLDVISGCDDQIVPTLSLGGTGVISVVANMLPKETAEICTRFFSGDVKGAAALQLKLLSLMNQLMIETNPIPAKAACAALGFGKNLLRLPLVPMEEGNRQKLLQLMRELDLEVME